MKLKVLILILLLAEFSVFAAPPTASDNAKSVVPEITNLDQITKVLKLGVWKDRVFTRKLRVAILDNGFGGYQSEIGKALPADTVYHQGPASAADRAETPSLHGTIMAKLVAQTIKKSDAKADYELHLFNAFGYTKFKDAVETVTRDRFDIVLYAQTWEFGGNGDAKGFINALVNQATQAGVIWINAAGEFGGHSRLEKINFQSEDGEDWVVFKDKKKKLNREISVLCHAPPKQQCPLHLVATWNDFKDDADTGTDKDIDMFLSDAKEKQLASSERAQKLSVDTSDSNSSIIPREMIEISVPPGVYKVKFKLKSKNFTPDQSLLRVIATGKFVQLDRPDTDDTLLPPADNPTVISVGASDDPDTSRSKKSGRPDVSIPSLVQLKNSNAVYSTSTASAIVAAVSALYLGTGGASDRATLVEKLKKLYPGSKAKSEAKSAPAPMPVTPDRAKPVTPAPTPAKIPPVAAKPSLPARPKTMVKSLPRISAPVAARQVSSPLCYPPVRLPVVYPQIARILSSGAVPVLYHGLIVIVTNPDFAAYSGLIPPDPSEYVYMTPDGPAIFDRIEIRSGLPPGYYLIYSENLPICE